jgi:hypothetical protein
MVRVRTASSGLTASSNCDLSPNGEPTASCGPGSPDSSGGPVPYRQFRNWFKFLTKIEPILRSAFEVHHGFGDLSDSFVSG